MIKKLIYIADNRIPTERAHGIQIMKMCEAFGLRGIEVELIIPKRFNFIKTDLFDYYGVKKVFKIRKIFSFDLTFFSPILGSLAFLWQSFWFAVFSFFYIFSRKADIIYSRDFFPLYFLSFFRKNLVYEIHTFPENPFWRKRTLKKAKKIIAITNNLKKFLIKEGIKKDKILVAPDGVDLEEFEIKENYKVCRRKLNLPIDKKIIMYSGHLFKWKGVATMLQAAQNFQSSIHADNLQDILFVFVGGTKKDIKNFQAQASSLKLNNVLIVGHRLHSEIPYWLKAADILVLPNSGKEKISKFYTSPLKLFEYMAAKKPIIASDLPSIKEILTENNAFLVEADNPFALVEAIKKGLKNKELSDKISHKAYSYVRENTWQKRTARILDFIA